MRECQDIDTVASTRRPPPSYKSLVPGLWTGRANNWTWQTDTHTCRQSHTKQANFTLTVLGPCLGTMSRQRDRWCRVGRRSVCAGLCVWVGVCMCVHVRACVCVYVPVRIHSCVFQYIFKQHCVLYPTEWEQSITSRMRAIHNQQNESNPQPTSLARLATKLSTIHTDL